MDLLESHAKQISEKNKADYENFIALLNEQNKLFENNLVKLDQSIVKKVEQLLATIMVRLGEDRVAQELMEKNPALAEGINLSRALTKPNDGWWFNSASEQTQSARENAVKQILHIMFPDDSDSDRINEWREKIRQKIWPGLKGEMTKQVVIDFVKELNLDKDSLVLTSRLFHSLPFEPIYTALKTYSRHKEKLNIFEKNAVRFEGESSKVRLNAVDLVDIQGTDPRSIRESYLRLPDKTKVDKNIADFREKEELRQELRALFFEVNFLKGRLKQENPSFPTVKSYLDQVVKLMQTMGMPAPLTSVTMMSGGTGGDGEKLTDAQKKQAADLKDKKILAEQKQKETLKRQQQEAKDAEEEKRRQDEVQKRIQEAAGLKTSDGDKKGTTETFKTLEEAFLYVLSQYRSAVSDLRREMTLIKDVIGNVDKKNTTWNDILALQSRLRTLEGVSVGKMKKIETLWEMVLAQFKTVREGSEDEEIRNRARATIDALGGDKPSGDAANVLQSSVVEKYLAFAGQRPELDTLSRQVDAAIKSVTQAKKPADNKGGSADEKFLSFTQSLESVQGTVQNHGVATDNILNSVEHLRETGRKLMEEYDEEVRDRAPQRGAPAAPGGVAGAPPFEAPPNHPVVRMLEEFRKRHRRDPDGANDALLTRVRMTGIDPEVMRPSFRDRIIFVGLTFGVRVFATTVTDALLRWNAIRSIYGAFGVYTALYTGGVLAAFLTVNSMGPDTRTSFNYLSVNAGGTAAVHILLNLGLSWLVLDLLSRNEVVNWRSPRLSPGERGRISYKVGTMSFVVWSILSVVALAV